MQISRARLWGGGGAGGGSTSLVYGGAAGSSAYVPSTAFARPASGKSKIEVGAGGIATPSNSFQEGQQGGRSAFWLDALGDPNPNVFASGAGGGQEGTPGAGGDGGWGGVYGGPDIAPDWILGGQGQASSSLMWFPKGADAPMGGCGGNNNQDGMQPGGGGAPGNHDFASGKGGDGMVCLDF